MAFIKTRKKILSSTIASTLSVVAMNAMAQDQLTQLETLESTAATAEQQSLKVDKSANNKILTSLLDAPKSVSIISQQMIEDTNVTTLADALRNVPGVTLGAGEGGNPNGDRPIIRGYNSESSMYVDGIRNSTSQNRDMFAVEQVEVTKGSGSSLGGAGSAGGSINMITKEAKKGSFIQGSVEQGTDDYRRITLDGNKDFGNGIAARVALMGHQNNKAGQDDGAEYKRAGIAPSITFGLDTDTRATLSYYYLKTDDTPDSGVPYNYVAGVGGFGKPVDVKQGIYYGWLARDFQKQENQIGTLKLEHDLTDDLTISNIAFYNNSKNDYLWTQPDDSKGNILNDKVWRRINARITDTDTYGDQLSLKGIFNTGILKHRFITGAEYSHQKTDIGGYDTTDVANGYTTPSSTGFNSACADANDWCTSLYSPNPSDPWTGNSVANKAKTTQTTKSTSVYFLDNIELSPQWLLDLGLRWDKFDTELVYNKEATSGRGASAVKIPVGTKYRSNTDFWNWNAGLTFKPAENGAIYASYATSSTPVGIDAGDGSEGISTGTSSYVNELKPEETRTMEIGTKWDLFNDKLNLTAAIFRTEKTNTRATDANGLTSNIGKTRVDGLELGLNGNITEKWAMALGYTYLDSELVDGGFTKVNDKYVPSPNNGKQVQNVAKNSATLWTTYDLTSDFTIGAGAVAMDKVYGDAANTKFVPGYVRYDAMARYNINKNVDLQLNVNNLSDKRYFTKAYGSHYATEAEGRNAVLSVNFKY